VQVRLLKPDPVHGALHEGQVISSIKAVAAAKGLDHSDLAIFVASDNPRTYEFIRKAFAVSTVRSNE
jgi:hypothetical protein